MEYLSESSKETQQKKQITFMYFKSDLVFFRLLPSYVFTRSEDERLMMVMSDYLRKDFD